MAQLTRRNFLIATGWIAAGATVLYKLSDRAIAVAPTIIFPDEGMAATWIQIRPDGSCLMYFPRMDMGQNANTGLAQIVAEELNISINDTISIGICFLVERRCFLSIQNHMPKRIEVMIIRINQVVPNVVSITFIGDVSSRMV